MIFVLTGQTSSGKTTMAKEMEEMTGFKRQVNYTTRPPREGEVDGIDYNFVSEKEINELDLIARNEFNTAFGKWIYGVNVADFEGHENTIVVLEASGALEMKERFGDKVKIVYIHASESLRRERAYARDGEKNAAEIERRIESDAQDFLDFYKHVDEFVVNHDKTLAHMRLLGYVVENSECERCGY